MDKRTPGAANTILRRRARKKIEGPGDKQLEGRGGRDKSVKSKTSGVEAGGKTAKVRIGETTETGAEGATASEATGLRAGEAAGTG